MHYSFDFMNCSFEFMLIASIIMLIKHNFMMIAAITIPDCQITTHNMIPIKIKDAAFIYYFLFFLKKFHSHTIFFKIIR